MAEEYDEIINRRYCRFDKIIAYFIQVNLPPLASLKRRLPCSQTADRKTNRQSLEKRLAFLRSQGRLSHLSFGWPQTDYMAGIGSAKSYQGSGHELLLQLWQIMLSAVDTLASASQSRRFSRNVPACQGTLCCVLHEHHDGLYIRKSNGNCVR